MVGGLWGVILWRACETLKWHPSNGLVGTNLQEMVNVSGVVRKSPLPSPTAVGASFCNLTGWWWAMDYMPVATYRSALHRFRRKGSKVLPYKRNQPAISSRFSHSLMREGTRNHRSQLVHAHSDAAVVEPVVTARKCSGCSDKDRLKFILTELRPTILPSHPPFFSFDFAVTSAGLRATVSKGMDLNVSEEATLSIFLAPHHCVHNHHRLLYIVRTLAQRSLPSSLYLPPLPHSQRDVPTRPTLSQSLVLPSSSGSPGFRNRNDRCILRTTHPFDGAHKREVNNRHLRNASFAG